MGCSQTTRFNTNSSSNLVISPFSLNRLVYLLGCGSDGQTGQVIGNRIGFRMSGLSTIAHYPAQMLPWHNNSYVHIGNAIYVSENYTINSRYQAIATNQFFSPIKSLDFSKSLLAVTVINNDVAVHTANGVTNIIAPNDITAQTEMIAVSAISFNQQWFQQFLPEQTRTQPFYTGSCNNSQQSEPVEMMQAQVTFKY